MGSRAVLSNNPKMKVVILCTILLITLTGLSIGCSRQESARDHKPGKTPTIEPTPGLVVYGEVRDANGAGMANVEIYRGYSSYPGELIATTDPRGHYESGFYYIPGDENVTISARQTGQEFEPEYYIWRHYHGLEKVECNFSARNPILSYLIK